MPECRATGESARWLTRIHRSLLSWLTRIATCGPTDEQDAGFLAAHAEGRIDLGEMKLEDVMLVRRQGRERMSQIVDILYGYGAAEEKK